MKNRQIVLVARPKGKLGLEHFRMVEGVAPEPKEGEALLRVHLISLDAANRAWMQGATYRSAVDAGSVMAGGAIAEVVTSRAPDFRPGDLVFADTGWQDYAAVAAKALVKVPHIEPMTHLLSVYGIAGLTAYFGLLRIGRPQPGETIVVSAAAGSVGSFVGQIAKIKGCRVVGIAGGAAKCDWLVKELGFDAAVDYKTGSVYAALKTATPLMNVRGRIVCCGAVSAYDGAAPAAGPRGVPGLIVVKRLLMQGFIVTDYFAERQVAVAELQRWVQTEQLKIEEDVIQGLENTPKALIGLLAGENRGKRMVRVSE